MLILKNKGVKQPKSPKIMTFIFTIIIGVSLVIFGVYGIYWEFTTKSSTFQGTIITKDVGSGRGGFWLNYSLKLNIDDNYHNFGVSRQIYNIFNVGDKVLINYKANELKTIKSVQ
jgi:hypothetical protein